MFLRAIVIFAGCVCLSNSTVRGGDWPSWRGANRDDISTETGLLKTWPEGGPPRLWTSADAGLGYSGFSVVNDVLYTMGADGTEAESREFVIAINATTGQKLWQTNVGTYLENGWGGGPRSTPSVADGLVVGLSGRGDLVCLATGDGAEKWRVNFSELGGTIPGWGYCESPLIDGDRVVVTPGGSEGAVACFNLQTGEKIWQSAEMAVAAHYSSIIAVDHFGTRQYIQLTESKVFGLDAATGKVLWQHDFPGRVAVIPTPTYRNGSVYLTAGYGTGCMLLNITADNKVEKIYENKVMKNQHGGTLLVGDHIYGHSDSNGIVCQDLNSGAQVWSDDKKDGSKSAVTFADGMLYFIEENSGACFLVEASPAGYRETGRFVLDPQTKQRNPQGRVWTHPVVANGKLYLRDQEIICCYNIAQ